MLFSEGRFFLFFALAFGVHWALRTNGARKAWLLACSYVFYAAWDWRFLGLILLSTVLDFSVGLLIGRARAPLARRAWLGVSMLANLGLLGFYKYFDFFATSATELLNALGFQATWTTLNLVLPVGISFYTFQTMSYTIDVYRGRLEPVRSPFDFALFVGFFPQLVAGPIVRATEFLPQLDERRVWSAHVRPRWALALFFWGYVKKACIADNAAVVVDRVFSDPTAFDAGGNWLGLLLYHVQIYGDFSGYSDMAIGTAGLLGYRLTDNFDFPYFAHGIGEFWRRWHISLGTWLKDYVYFPLGGSRISWPNTLRNVFVTMILCGMWHGAGWKYPLFGAIHAVYVAWSRYWKRWVPRESLLGRATTATIWLWTTLLLLLGWVIFRGVGAAEMIGQYRVLLGVEEGGPERIDPAWWGFVAGLAVVHWAFWKRIGHARVRALPDWGFALLYGAGWAIALPFVATGFQPFIYFQF